MDKAFTMSTNRSFFPICGSLVSTWCSMLNGVVGGVTMLAGLQTFFQGAGRALSRYEVLFNQLKWMMGFEDVELKLAAICRTLLDRVQLGSSSVSRYRVIKLSLNFKAQQGLGLPAAESVPLGRQGSKPLCQVKPRFRQLQASPSPRLSRHPPSI